MYNNKIYIIRNGLDLTRWKSPLSPSWICCLIFPQPHSIACCGIPTGIISEVCQTWHLIQRMWSQKFKASILYIFHSITGILKA